MRINLIQELSNLILSIILVNIIGVTGVIVATIITNLFISHIVEPYVLYKNAFLVSPKKYYRDNYIMIVVFVLALFVLEMFNVDIENNWLQLLINGSLSVLISTVMLGLLALIKRDTFKYLLNFIRKKKH